MTATLAIRDWLGSDRDEYCASISAANLLEIASENLGSIPKCQRIILGVSMRVSALHPKQKILSEQTLG
jgi:hypothetical protein